MRASRFKTDTRSKRQQLPEASFNMGMRWTNAPLPEGQSRLLVNYDIKDKGNILSPRPGLRVRDWMSDERAGPEGGEILGAVVPWSPTMSVVAGKSCAESDGAHAQILIADVGAQEVDTETGLVKGSLWNYTGASEGDRVWDASELRGRDAVSNIMHITTGWALFKKIPADGVHRIDRDPTVPLNEVVGAFAYGNQFFHFRKALTGYELCTSRYDEVSKQYKPEAVPPKEISPKEAVLWGYNMLDETPYTFNNSNTAGVINLLGILPYDESGNLQLSPVQNQTIKFVCNYACPVGKTHRFVWEWKDIASTSWTTLKDGNVSTGALAEASCVFSSPVAATLIKVTVYDTAAPSVIAQVMAVGFNFNKAAQGSTANIAPVNYDLHSCEGMTYWRNQLVLWAPKQDRTMMFISDINAPHYFPYPQKAEIFDEPILHAVPLLDVLLVFTSTTLVQLTLAEDGLGWNKKTLQRNLEIQPGDVHLIQAVKNMVFFKSGNFYYMVVPSAKAFGELAIAPVSNEIRDLLENFGPTITQLLFDVYGYQWEMTLINYYNFLDFEDIHNIYMFRLQEGRVINVDLVYNTMDRAWRTYTFESTRQVRPYKQDATTRGVYVSLFEYTALKPEPDVSLPAVQFLSFHPRLVEDAFIPDGLHWPVTDPWLMNPLPVPDGWESLLFYEQNYLRESMRAYSKYQNWQLWDTGYREHNTDFKKHYREIQLKLNNSSQEQLYFYSEFYVDGERRKGMYTYRSEHIQDPADPNFGLLYVVPELVDSTVVPGTTVLADGNDPSVDGWLLDASLFPEMTIWKIRLAVSGKGYTPRFLLVSRNVATYELLNINWVFREMYSR